MQELSEGYRLAAQTLDRQIKALWQQLRQSSDPEDRWHIRRQIAVLTPIRREMQDLAQLTLHYYDRGYPHNEKYCF